MSKLFDRAATGLLLRRVATRLTERASRRIPPTVIVSLPKSGTHLLVRCVQLLGGHVRNDFALTSGWVAEQGPDRDPDGEQVPMGVSRCSLSSRRRIERLLAGLWAGEVAYGHVPYGESFVGIVERLGISLLQIVRDPRDAVVSHVARASRLRHHRLYHVFRNLKHPDRQLMAAIIGIDPATVPGTGGLASIQEQLDAMQPWLSAALCHTTRFEDLVGPQGGGDVSVQAAEIAKIATHLGVPCGADRVAFVASRLFGQGSKTFRQGRLGSWRSHFKLEHKEAFKRLAGRQLIELGYERDLDW